MYHYFHKVNVFFLIYKKSFHNDFKCAENQWTTLAWLLFRRVLMTLHPDNRNPHTHMHMNIFSGMSGCICDTYVCKCTSLDIFRYIRPLTCTGGLAS